MTDMDIIIKKHQELYEYFIFLINKNKITNFKVFPNYYDKICVVSCLSVLYDVENINDIIIEKLNNANIVARKYYHPLTDEKIANNMFNRIVCIPCNKDLTTKDIDFIFNIITQI